MMKMTAKNGLVILCVLAFISLSALVCSGQLEYNYNAPQYIAAQPVPAGQTTSSTVTSNPTQESNYCVAMGYLYTTNPTLNGGRGVCVFSDNTYCDAHLFYTGNCSPSPYISYNPYVYYNPYVETYNPYLSNVTLTGLDLAEATSSCRVSGGIVQSVHTPYGDVDMCVFPDGSSVDLRDLYYNTFGGPTGTYYGPYSDNWFYTAYAFLNSP